MNIRPRTHLEINRAYSRPTLTYFMPLPLVRKFETNTFLIINDTGQGMAITIGRNADLIGF